MKPGGISLKVRLLKPTIWDEPLKVGDEVDIDTTTGARWLNKGIAEEVIDQADNENQPGQKNDNQTTDTTEPTATTGETAGAVGTNQTEPAVSPSTETDLTVAELRENAKVAGISGYSKMNKEALVEALKTVKG